MTRMKTLASILLLISVVAPLLAACDDGGNERRQLARQILDDRGITLATTHSSGVRDEANARQNILDTANGRAARRSSYGTAPGGAVNLNTTMLDAMVALGRAWDYRISEIAGGSHSAGSRHYSGKAIDVDMLEGRPVNSSNPYVERFLAACRRKGAIETLGPGDPGHSTHLHCAWP